MKYKSCRRDSFYREIDISLECDYPTMKIFKLFSLF